MPKQEESPLDRLLLPFWERLKKEVQHFERLVNRDHTLQILKDFFNTPVKTENPIEANMVYIGWMQKLFVELTSPIQQSRYDFLYENRYRVARLTREEFGEWNKNLHEFEEKFAHIANKAFSRQIDLASKETTKHTEQDIFTYLQKLKPLPKKKAIPIEEAN